MKKLDLAKVKASQTVYLVESNLKDNPELLEIKWSISKVHVDNSPAKKPGTHIIQDGKISRYDLHYLAKFTGKRSDFVFRTANQAKKMVEAVNRAILNFAS